jgi:hypothetical protein
VDQANTQNQLTYADIYAAINAVRPAGYTIWVRIAAAPQQVVISTSRLTTEGGVVLDTESNSPIAEN